MRGFRTAAVASLATLGLSHCTTEVCGCPPAFVSAVVAGQVLGGLSTPVQAASVRAYSAAGPDCHSMDTDFGSVTTEADGSFELGLAAAGARDSVCVFVFARPPEGASGLGNSDTTMLVMDFRDGEQPDNARVDLALHTLP